MIDLFKFLTSILHGVFSPLLNKLGLCFLHRILWSTRLWISIILLIMDFNRLKRWTWRSFFPMIGDDEIALLNLFGCRAQFVNNICFHLIFYPNLFALMVYVLGDKTRAHSFSQKGRVVRQRFILVYQQSILALVVHYHVFQFLITHIPIFVSDP